jgi:hypothetical protein
VPRSFDLYVPPEHSPLRGELLPGSAVVGELRRTDDGDLVFQIDFEGNRYGAVNLQTYGQRCMQAAGRMAADYPTTARRLLSSDQAREQLDLIGTYDDGERLVYLDGEAQRARLADWLGVDEIADAELHARG